MELSDEPDKQALYYLSDIAANTRLQKYSLERSDSKLEKIVIYTMICAVFLVAIYLAILVAREG